MPAHPLRAFHCSCAFQSPLSWLPNMAPTIGGLTILMSASTLADGVSPDIALDAAIRRGAENVRLEPLTHEEAKRCIAEKLAQYGKKLDDAQMTELLRRRDCTLPLFIQVAVEELRVFGIYEQVLQRIQRLPERISDLFDQALERLEEDHGMDLLKDFVCLLYCSPHGLTEDELRAMLHINLQQFSGIRISLSPYLEEVEIAGSAPRMKFSASTALNDAIYKRYSQSAGRCVSVSI